MKHPTILLIWFILEKGRGDDGATAVDCSCQVLVFHDTRFQQFNVSHCPLKPLYGDLTQERMGLEIGCAAGIGIGVVLVLLVLLIKSYWPIFLTITLGLIGWRFWRRRQRAIKARQAFLQQTFYQVLQANRGRITVFDFAVQTNLTGPEARAFLNARAREFYANFEPNDHGDVLYIFPTLSSISPSAVSSSLDQPNQSMD